VGFRFRKRISFGKFLHFNLSKSGVSTSIGRPGATVNLGKRPKLTVGIPGTGLSYQASLPKRKRTKSMPASPPLPPPPPDPLALKRQRVFEIFNDLKTFTVDEQNPAPGFQRVIKLCTELVELLRSMQALRPGEPIERALKNCERLLEFNRWEAINYTDHTEETRDANKSAAADFEATKLTDQQWEEFWRHVGPPLPATSLAQARVTPAQFNKGVERLRYLMTEPLPLGAELGRGGERAIAAAEKCGPILHESISLVREIKLARPAPYSMRLWPILKLTSRCKRRFWMIFAPLVSKQENW
jgi:hypothetical protein